MSKNNKNATITLTGKEIVVFLREFEYIFISLRNIGDYYYFGSYADRYNDEEKDAFFCREIAGFVCKNKIANRLANIRKKLYNRFNNSISMEALEKELEGIKFWEKPGD